MWAFGKLLIHQGPFLRRVGEIDAESRHDLRRNHGAYLQEKRRQVLARELQTQGSRWSIKEGY